MLMTLLNVDKTLFLWCNRYQQNRLILKLFREISRTGDGYMYIAIGVFALLLDPIQGLAFCTLGLAAFAIEIPSFITLKKWIRRDRPFVKIDTARNAITPSDKFSLPSGHTTAAFVMASLIYVFYPEWAGLAFAWASLIGLSRVILGVHYPTDILAGALLGISCTQLAMIWVNVI